jgi:hypothetical protein
MTEMMTRRAFGAFAVAALSLALAQAVPAAAASGQATGKRAHKPMRFRAYYRNAGDKKITSGACILGEPDYDPDQCYKDIKD